MEGGPKLRICEKATRKPDIGKLIFLKEDILKYLSRSTLCGWIKLPPGIIVNFHNENPSARGEPPPTEVREDTRIPKQYRHLPP